MNLRDELRRTARRVLASQGFELRRMNRRGARGLDDLLIRLLREKTATVVLDVGANRGRFFDYLRGQGYEGRVISFEPLSEPFATLARRAEGNPRWDAVQVAISDAPGAATMHRSGKADVMSSLLTTTDVMLSAMPAAAATEDLEVRVSTVDEQVRQWVRDTDRPFLKVDTQGSELSVLQGAEATLARAAGVLVELSFVELYAGQALFGEIVDWLAARDHFLLALDPAYRDRTTGQLMQVDALFGMLPIPL